MKTKTKDKFWEVGLIVITIIGFLGLTFSERKFLYGIYLFILGMCWGMKLKQ